MADGQRFAKQLEQCRNMGFPENVAQPVLIRFNGNVDQTVEFLLKGEAPPPYTPSYGNTAGRSNTASAPEYVAAPPAYNQCDTTFEPPPYTKSLIDDTVKDWEKDSSAGFYVDAKDLARELPLKAEEDVRCSSCFDPIGEKERVVKDTIKTYHYDCYMKVLGPKCTYCCRPLTIPNKERELSGFHLVYHGSPYHVECYEKYAGPRCSLCCDVIIERPNGEFSGQWIQDGTNMLHKECYEKKLKNQYRATLA